MAKRSGPQLLLFLLVVAGFSQGADIKVSIRKVATAKTWEEARQRCQELAVDLAIVGTVTAGQISNALIRFDLTERVWVGLHRDPESEGVWRWIDRRTGEGFAGSDVSSDNSWAAGEQAGHCAAVGDDDPTWHSELCSTPHHFYCSSDNTVTFVELEYSWDAAEDYCQTNSMTLATATSANSEQFDKVGWIGLRREGGDTWKWSDSSPVDYTNWALGEPRTRDCASFNGTSKQLHSHECSQELLPFCFKDNMVLVKLEKNWEEAVAYCRELELDCSEDECVPVYDLVTPDNDIPYINDRMYREGTTDEVWVGLRYLAGDWFGLQGEPLGIRETLPNSPSQQRCGAVAKYNAHDVMLRNCTERKNFICFKL